MIANIQIEGPWLRVYDLQHNQISQMPCIRLSIVAIAPTFFVTQEGPWIFTYNEHCQRIGQMLPTDVIIRRASGQTFFTIEGSYMKMYDMKCHCIHQRKIRIRTKVDARGKSKHVVMPIGLLAQKIALF